MPGADLYLAFERLEPNSTLDSLGQVEGALKSGAKEFETSYSETLDKRKSLAYRRVLSAQIAQLVEQRIENPRVAGSIPALGTIFLSFFQKVRLQRQFCFLRPNAAR
jgi:hypothetical protein